MNVWNRRLLLLSFLFAEAVVGMLGCSSGNPITPVTPETVRGVAVIAAQSNSVPDSLEAIGTVRAAQTSQIASQSIGNILEVRAREGDRVQSGQILAVIDDAQPRAAVQQAEAGLTAAQKEVASADTELALAQSTLKRYQQLFDKKSVSPQEFDEIKTRSQAAEARRDIARAGEAQASAVLTQSKTALGNTRIRAPFSGVVTEKRTDAGALASPGMPLFTLEDTSRYRLETMVNENDIHLVHAGEAIPVLLDAIEGSEFHGKVLRIAPAADTASRSFLVKIELPVDSRLRSGLFGRARFPRGVRSAVFVPHGTIVERGQLRGVFVVDASQIAQLRYVTLGNTSEHNVEVLSGLQVGEKLVAVPGDRELGGKKIAPLP
ncbi:MAG TPA: efflux RND transporter periplasmic adaptor subunit [Candidatus Saccharimonadales bacterium]|jgi:RND family efflux transporter MFP subunit|nr:efflux RND transporter periplasmic adaptor subunit [Candidatus Saccharimonadales bacterium]